MLARLNQEAEQMYQEQLQQEEQYQGSLQQYQGQFHQEQEYHEQLQAYQEQQLHDNKPLYRKHDGIPPKVEQLSESMHEQDGSGRICPNWQIVNEDTLYQAQIALQEVQIAMPKGGPISQENLDKFQEVLNRFQYQYKQLQDSIAICNICKKKFNWWTGEPIRSQKF